MASTPTLTDLAGHDVPRPELTPVQERAVIHATSELIAAAVQRRQPRLTSDELAGAAEVPIAGCFVSIKRKGQLRGCCGYLGRRSSLLSGLTESAKTSAIGDIRLPSVVVDELPHLELEIWLLYAQRPITASGDERVSAVEVGRHGLQVQRDQARGLLLPGVATDHEMNARTFLQQVCLKAGLTATAWHDDQTQLATFEGRVVKGPFDTGVLTSAAEVPLMFTESEILRLGDFCRDNIIAMARGAVPNYFLAGCADGAVHGLHLAVHIDGDPSPLQLSRIVLRNPAPMQSTLFQMCETLGLQLKARGATRLNPQQTQIELGILYAPAVQGTVAAPDLTGVDPRRRALLVTEQTRSAWRFDPQLTAEQLLAVVTQQVEVTVPENAAVYSLIVQSNRVRLNVVDVPRPRLGPEVRPPAVAGMFYPADPQHLSALMDDLLPQEPASAERWRAAMVPHAGLIYSGGIAADVLRRIQFPRTVIILGPKHTAAGVEWAIAPHRTWSLPGITLASDPVYARHLAENIRGLRQDEAAHRREHAIEVELPWIARFAPQSRVLGIAIGHANFELCQQFATDFANVLRDDLDDTLLLISSDMNHFATDAETRRIDTLALEALETLDAQTLYRTVREHNISMCGVLPACIVLETLRQLGPLSTCRRIAYGTSADTSGDTSRVVGYAGMLFR